MYIHAMCLHFYFLLRTWTPTRCVYIHVLYYPDSIYPPNRSYCIRVTVLYVIDTHICDGYVYLNSV